MIQSNARVTNEGIAFQVQVEFRFNSRNSGSLRDCFISNEVLKSLGEGRVAPTKPEEIFRALQEKIAGVARRLAQAGVQGSPLQLTSGTFH
ncbi:MAG: hypothetical protein JWP36_294 [Paucimonas sp.]|jgi:hypothetical protein|nr:hypothetical protein [Paucimonas sp.]